MNTVETGSTTSSTRTLHWSDALPHVDVFDPDGTPTRVVGLLHRAIRDHNETAALGAAAMIRTWWQSLPEHGQRTDPYPGLIGDDYLWSALQLVALAGEQHRTAPDDVWNVLRRAEANLRTWWLQQRSTDTTTVLLDTNPTMGGWEWIEGKE